MSPRKILDSEGLAGEDRAGDGDVELRAPARLHATVADLHEMLTRVAGDPCQFGRLDAVLAKNALQLRRSIAGGHALPRRRRARIECAASGTAQTQPKTRKGFP